MAQSSTEEPGGFVQLRVIVVGAGIAGFAVATTLRKAGHKVKILERSRFTREAGFGISIAPNASKVLKVLEFDFARAGAVDCSAVSIRDPETLEIQKQFSVTDSVERWGGRWCLMLRPDIHNELKRLALMDDGATPTPELILGIKVAAVDIERGTVTLEDGTVHTGDLIIGADGERSLVQKAVSNSPSKLRESPVSIFRCIVPVEDMLSDPITREVYESRKNMFCMYVGKGGYTILTWFECRNGNLQDIEASYMNINPDGSKKEFDKGKLQKALIDEFKDCHPALIRALEKVQHPTNWTINFAQPLSNWTKAKGVILGDAAHSMYPTTGQGGCQSIEDAGALGVLLGDLTSLSEIPDRLALFDRLRRTRASTMQAMSSTVFGSEQNVHRRMWKYLPSGGPFRSTQEYQDYNNRYNVLEESKLALEEMRRTNVRGGKAQARL
ncbi:hypothetical protein FQN49_002927 [Arthroderma sp. PD_2]|nr:hypothetical protein FQN49_002927 [Arthroderma sp. PD_2]